MTHTILAVIAIMAVTGCQCGLEPLAPAHCGDPCWADDAGIRYDPDPTANVGPCRAGHVQCPSGDCVGYVGPAPEACNGIDDDCDGYNDATAIDGGAELLGLDRYPSDPANDCPKVGACQNAYERCEGTAGYRCEYTDGPSPEICNGIDDNCNGQVDEGLDQPQFYYPEDQYPGTVGIGACKPGVRVCVNGVEHDTQPVTPQPEVCDGIDNDCNGVVDDTGDNVAVALVVDADMPSGYTLLVANAVCGVPGAVPTAVVLTGTAAAPWAATLLDFGTAAEACAALSNPALYSETATSEFQFPLEGVELAFDALMWPAGATRRVLVFDDEDLVPFQVTAPDVVGQCATYEVDAFVDSDYASYAALTNGCGGKAYALTLITAQDIQDRFAGGCP